MDRMKYYPLISITFSVKGPIGPFNWVEEEFDEDVDVDDDDEIEDEETEERSRALPSFYGRNK